MLSQVDSEGHNYKILNEVTYHKRDESATTKLNGLTMSINGNLHWKRTTCGLKILLEQKDFSVDWFPLK